MDELKLDEPEDTETRSSEVVPPVQWDTHPVVGKNGSDVLSSGPDAISGKNDGAHDVEEGSQFHEDCAEIEVDLVRCSLVDECDLISQTMATVKSSGNTVQLDREKGSEEEEEVFTEDVRVVATENAAPLHESRSGFILKMEFPDRTECARNLNDASDVLLQREAEVDMEQFITVKASPHGVDLSEPNRVHKSDSDFAVPKSTEVVDDISHVVRTGEVTTHVASSSAELDTAASNQNSEPNQNIFRISPANEKAKNGQHEDRLNRNFASKDSHRKSRTTDDLPTGVKSKQRHAGHLALDELTPTNSRRSYRSKRRHLNSSNSGRHGESRKRGDNRTAGGDDSFEPTPSAAERKRLSDVLGCVTEDASLFLASAGNWHEVNSEGECCDAIVRKSSYLRAVKVAEASLIGDAKVHRSTSYRIATARHPQVATPGESDLPPEVILEGDVNPKTDPSSRSTRTDHTTTSQVAKETPEASHSDEGVRKAKSDRRGSSHHGRRLSLAKDLLLLSPTAISAAQSWSDAGVIALAGAADLATTPTKSSGIRRLKELFMEKSSPKDGSSADHAHFVYEDNRQETSSSSSGAFEGQLTCKNTMMDGKRSTDRTWKCVHAVLRGHHLYLHPDKATQSVLVYDHAISVKNALVDIAYDYVKRKNVFRLTTYNISEFLFEASDQDVMLHWIHSIQECGYLISDKEFSASRELIRQKRLISRQASRSGTHDSSHRKHSDSSRSPRLASKIPEPVGLPRTRKTSREPSKSPQREPQATDEETPKSPQRKSTVALLRHADNSEQKSKDVRTWKSKMVKKFKRLSSQSPAATNAEQIGAFGVELDKCIPSPNNEFVPLIVDACITIVESKGLTNKGIYRVPGNSAAIAQLQAELNKDPTSINLESEKWQDVNAVISLLKLFFRELPDPLITKELYPSMIEANRVDDSTKRMLKIKRLLHHLPAHNFETFHFLACHLNKVSSAGDINMMDARNLAIVFGPTLLQPKQDMLNMVKDMSDQCRIVESVILHCDWFFSSWDEDVNVPADGEKDSSMVPITGMDQQLIEKAEHMVLEEQTQNSKKLWRPNANRRPNPKERCTGSVGGFLDANNERNIDEEMIARGGEQTEKRPTARGDGKNAKTRAKSVPPRPGFTLQVQPGKPVERMIETAPAKRKNSSPVTFQRRESAVPEGSGNARHQFHRSSSEASEKTYRVSSGNARVRQFGGVTSTKAVLFEQQHANNRNRKSISSNTLFNAKFAQGHKLSPGSTPRGSEERLGSPHSRSGSRGMLAGDVGEARRRKQMQHAKAEGSGMRGVNSKNVIGAKKLDITSRKEGVSETRSVGGKSPDLVGSMEDAKTVESGNLEGLKKNDGKIGEPIGVRIVEEPCLVLRQADSRRVWNATNEKWEELPKNSSASPKKSPVKSNVENNQMSDVSSTRLNDEDAADLSNADRAGFLAEKSNVSPRLGSKQRTEDVLEISDLSLERQVICEDKENHIEVILSDTPDSSIIRLSPIRQLLHKPDASGSPGKTSRSLSPDSTLPSLGDVPPTPPTMRVVLRRNHPDFARTEQRREVHSRPRIGSLLVSPNSDQQPSQERDSRRLTLDGSNEDELEPLANDSTSKAFHRTSSEPNLRVMSPVVLQLKGSPKREPRPRQGGRASLRSHGPSHHQHNTLPPPPLGAGLRDRKSKDGSRSLTYESSV